MEEEIKLDIDIQKKKLSEIKAFWRNPRKNLKAIEVVKSSIREYGYTNPIIVDKKNVIITGHTRYIALTQLGVKEAYVIVSTMSARKAKEYRIIDNKSSEVADWDVDKLMPELREIGGISGFEGFFPELKLVSIDGSEDKKSLFNFTEETDIAIGERIEKKTDEMNSRFEDLSEKRKSDQLEIMCPDCGESFYLSQHDFEQGLKAKRIREGIEENG